MLARTADARPRVKGTILPDGCRAAIPVTYSSFREWPRSRTTTEREVREAISFAMVRPTHPPPAITTFTGFSCFMKRACPFVDLPVAGHKAEPSAKLPGACLPFR